ncbi:MAG: secretion protein F [Clostridia bacterium]|nr:secretion protein F [Clostridia bacterium]
MIQAMVGALIGVGLFFILADSFRIPYYKSSKAVDSLSKKQRDKQSALDTWLSGIAEWLAKHMRMNEFKKARLTADLKTAQMDMTPERFTANAIVKSSLVAVLAIPAAFIFPILVPFVVIVSIIVYRLETKSVVKRIKAKRDNIEYELPRLVSTIEKTLTHNRDVLYMLESYSQNAGPELKRELEITVADMRSGNYEGAIKRLESRVGSSMMSDVCRGLIGIIRGDDNRVYWASLEIKFSDSAREKLRARAQKAPRKVRRLSLCLLICFMLVYVVVILEQIMSSIGVMFA